MRAADVMTKTVVSIGEEASTTEASVVMERARVSGLPVVDSCGKPIGIVTRSDLIRLGVPETQERSRSMTKVRDAMTQKLITVTEETQLSEIVALLNCHHIKRAPVMDGDKMVGIVSRGDLIHALAWVFGAQESQEILDADLKRRILAQLDSVAANWRPSFEIFVRNGEVELRGTSADKRLRDAVRLSVANTEGVQEIHSHLDWMEPEPEGAEPSLRASVCRPGR